MTHKHLHELLQQDQEPFHLKNFISDHRTKLTTNTIQQSLIIKKQKPITKNKSLTTPSNFCINHVCLFSYQDSPEYKKSPFLDFPARELKSPCNNAAVFLNIPTRTAALLLDAATRVQKAKRGSKQVKFGLLGSFFRRFKDRSTRTKRRGIEQVNETTPSDEDVMVMEASCASRPVDEFEEINECFHFSLGTSPSPVASPSRHFQEDKESYEVRGPEDIKRQDDDDKEQCSPVSVLDPLFEDDEEAGGVAEDDGYDIECSYANVQRAKHQLLQKLKRFEQLAGLDPIDLENHMLEQSSSEDQYDFANGEDVTNGEYFREIVNHLGVGKIPWYMKKLVFDLIEEENKNKGHEMIVQSVCKKLHSWKVVELNTIDMIVETDFRNEGWRRCDKETIRDMGMDIEMAIFGFLTEELAQELVFQ